ncbi:hypothetical protein CPB84DRAFT_1858084 [Gymnopilus junonius]|uniref:Uncharacterized protein n=1 Tax=Gymnopilus junonius TaxID=109634 RepID=A0A9P5N893_GYMJU|nr:hypothetical protein CPB84DRAFT_1858084 [Gymnopilus junonius]
MVESATNSPASGVNEILSNIPAHPSNSEHAPSTSPDNQGSPPSNERDTEAGAEGNEGVEAEGDDGEELEPDPDFDDARPQGQIWTAKEKKVLGRLPANIQSNSPTQERKVHCHGSHEGHQEDVVGMIRGKNIEERPGSVGRVEKEETANFNWFLNHGGSGCNLKIPGFTLKVTFDSVLKELKRSEIIAVAKSLGWNGVRR